MVFGAAYRQGFTPRSPSRDRPLTGDAISCRTAYRSSAPGDHVDNAVRANAALVGERVAADPVMARGVRDGSVAVVCAQYDLDTGRVDLLP